MSTTLQPPPAKKETSQAAAAPLPAPGPAPPSFAPPSESSSGAWFGDRVAVAVWIGGASLMAFLLLKDLIFSILLG